MSFAEVLGHDHVKAVLGRLLSRGRLPGALLLTGPAGVGKKKLALEVARALVCEQPPLGEEPQACGRCGACGRSGKGIHPDVFVILPATKNAIKIDQVRDSVREILSRPFEGRARAFVIDDAHLLTEEASNALLKSLEEPPATSHVLLVTGAPQSLLPTIRSRCQTVRVGALPPALVQRYLEETVGLSADDAHLRAVLAGGSLGQALAFESDAYRGARDGVLRLLETVPGGDMMARLESSDWLAEQEDVTLAVLALRSLVRDVAAVSIAEQRGTSADERLLNADVAERVLRLARGPLGARGVALWDAISDTQEALRGNANKPLTMDVLVDAVAGA
jgi:DNA polymerase-3 subunit delta'